MIQYIRNQANIQECLCLNLTYFFFFYLSSPFVRPYKRIEDNHKLPIIYLISFASEGDLGDSSSSLAFSPAHLRRRPERASGCPHSPAMSHLPGLQCSLCDLGAARQVDRRLWCEAEKSWLILCRGGIEENSLQVPTYKCLQLGKERKKQLIPVFPLSTTRNLTNLNFLLRESPQIYHSELLLLLLMSNFLLRLCKIAILLPQTHTHTHTGLSPFASHSKCKWGWSVETGPAVAGMRLSFKGERRRHLEITNYAARPHHR